MQDMRRNFFTYIYRDLHGDAMLVLIQMATDIASENQQKHLSLSFATKKRELISRETQKH